MLFTITVDKDADGGGGGGGGGGQEQQQRTLQGINCWPRLRRGCFLVTMQPIGLRLPAANLLLNVVSEDRQRPSLVRRAALVQCLRLLHKMLTVIDILFQQLLGFRASPSWVALCCSCTGWMELHVGCKVCSIFLGAVNVQFDCFSEIAEIRFEVGPRILVELAVAAVNRFRFHRFWIFATDYAITEQFFSRRIAPRRWRLVRRLVEVGHGCRSGVFGWTSWWIWTTEILMQLLHKSLSDNCRASRGLIITEEPVKRTQTILCKHSNLIMVYSVSKKCMLFYRSMFCSELVPLRHLFGCPLVTFFASSFM